MPDGPVRGSFNHPSADQYNNWDFRDSKVADVLTMLEVINSNNRIHHEAFVYALDKGWKVAPVAGNDNHGTTGISRNVSTTSECHLYRFPAHALSSPEAVALPAA